MKMKLLVLAFIVVPPLIAFAADPGSIELRSSAEVEIEIVNEKGEKELKRGGAEEAEVYPGDEVIFTTHYKHVGKKPADNVVITNPVPKHMIYTGRSAEGKGTEILFSIDGGKTYDKPSKLKVRTMDGKERVASPSDYTHIRWSFKADLKQGEEGSVTFRAKLK